MHDYDYIRDQFGPTKKRGFPSIIGLAGYAQSGKDTAARYLAERGYERRAFADGVRVLCRKTDPILDRYVAERGWEEAKRDPTTRQYLQSVGLACRDVFGPDVWVDLALKGLPALTVVTDVRFPNEADAIRERGGVIWRIIRPDTGPVNGHVSETAMTDYRVDRIVRNSGTPADLRTAVLNALVGDSR